MINLYELKQLIISQENLSLNIFNLNKDKENIIEQLNNLDKDIILLENKLQVCPLCKQSFSHHEH